MASNSMRHYDVSKSQPVQNRRSALLRPSERLLPLSKWPPRSATNDLLIASKSVILLSNQSVSD